MTQLDDTARRRLAELVSRYGGSFVDDPRRAKAMLADTLPGYPAEVAALSAVIDEGLVGRLRNPPPEVPRQVLVGQLAAQLGRQRALSPAAARWAVESWAIALAGPLEQSTDVATTVSQSDRERAWVKGRDSGAGGARRRDLLVRAGAALGVAVLALAVAFASGIVSWPGGPAATRSPTRPDTANATATPGVTPSAGPTATPIVTPRARPTASRSPTIEPTPTLDPTPADAQATLLSHVPAAVRDSCSAGTWVVGAIASTECTAGDNNSIYIFYALFTDPESMQTAYDDYKLAFGSDAGNDTCSKGGNWPSEYGYTIDNSPVGRVLCDDVGGPEFYWTDDRFSILSWAYGYGDISRADLYTFWHDDSGPY